jgi:hypothetical protein
MRDFKIVTRPGKHTISKYSVDLSSFHCETNYWQMNIDNGAFVDEIGNKEMASLNQLEYAQQAFPSKAQSRIIMGSCSLYTER